MPQLRLADLLSPERVRVPLESTDKTGLIEELCALLARVGDVEDETETILRAVLEREEVLSTGIGGGVALPHAKCAALDELVLVGGRTREPVDFDALDDGPVHLVMMLVGPESSAGLHVKVLSRISRVLRRGAVRRRLIAAETPREFLATIQEAESR